ncbi:MAG: NAD-dependent protein deacylase [Methanobrevibacter sp.]|jgi:NAD-dependent deacetylase|nr:NAD-dependent protein deacylase [Methanobrevibacter sp.]
MDEIETLKELIAESDNIVFFGGAGVSTESGIPDFRSEDGIYKAIADFGDRPERILSYSYFLTRPEDFYKFYKEIIIFQDAKPNPAHLAIGKLEDLGKIRAVVTQNIDGLHQKGGSKNVLELHGSVYRNYCMECNASYDLDYILSSDNLPICSCGGLIKPDVVLYEEPLDNSIMDKAIKYISEAELLIVGGTSLVVYPAAGLVDYFDNKNGKLVLINKSYTPYDNQADLVINKAIGEVFQEIVKDY